MEWVSYKICENYVLGYVGLYFLCVMADIDGPNSDVSDLQNEGENDSGSESYISVSTVNTEDLSDLSFSEDEDVRVITSFMYFFKLTSLYLPIPLLVKNISLRPLLSTFLNITMQDSAILLTCLNKIHRVFQAYGEINMALACSLSQCKLEVPISREI